MDSNAAWIILGCFAVASVMVIAIGFLLNRAEDQRMAADPLNHRQHRATILRDLVQALTLARQDLGLGDAGDNDPDYPVLQYVRGEARRGLGLGGQMQAAPQQPTPPAQAPAGQPGVQEVHIYVHTDIPATPAPPPTPTS